MHVHVRSIKLFGEVKNNGKLSYRVHKLAYNSVIPLSVCFCFIMVSNTSVSVESNVMIS